MHHGRAFRGCWHTRHMTSRPVPMKVRSWRLLLAALAAAAIVALLGAGTASAATVTGAETRVGPSTVPTAYVVGPFWVESQNTWVDAIDLKPGDVVVDAYGDRLTVTILGASEQELTAYNLSVEGLHTSFAGIDAVLVTTPVA